MHRQSNTTDTANAANAANATKIKSSQAARQAFLSSDERAFLQAVSQLNYCNPFLPERVTYEQNALGSDFVETLPFWSMQVADPDAPYPNTALITQRTEVIIKTLRSRLEAGLVGNQADLCLYEDAVLWVLYHHLIDSFQQLILRAEQPTASQPRVGFYPPFVRDWEYYFNGLASLPLQIKSEQSRSAVHQAPHVFACFFQLYRAYHHIYRAIIGSSMAAARLRAAVWQSVFTHDMRRYRRILYTQMGDFTTLITGPSGTGKELVARSIGLSRYIPFNPKTLTFSENFAAMFHPINLSALPSSLIESELFGHRRGAFTGALQDRKGWLEQCSPLGTVFLDEIGDLDTALQVKLLRVIQTRTFQPVGDSVDRHFQGKLIAATNRDLAAAMQQGHFREDFYYRLCSDRIVTPSFHEQLTESPEVLHELLLFITQQVVGAEAEDVAAEVNTWIVDHLGYDYPWPGNIRELEQCVRNVLIRREYHPPQAPALPAREALWHSLSNGAMTADELLSWYCTAVYAQTGNYEETARRLRLDRRTVKKKINPDQLADWQAKSDGEPPE